MGRTVALALALVSLNVGLAVAATCGSGLDAWTVPPGFKLQAYHDGKIPKARSLALSGKSSVKGPVITYVSAMNWDLANPTPQVITAMVDATGRGAADYTFPITDATTFEGAALPNGIAWYKDDLYVAVLKADVWCRLYRIKGVDSLALNKKVASASDVEILRDDLPPDFMHGWKFIRFDKKGNLILPIGSNANIVNQDGTQVVRSSQWANLDAADPKKNATSQLFQKADGYPKYRFASIYLIKPPYTGGIPGQKGDPPIHIAEGVRNTVGFDFHPRNGLYFTDNGRDNIGGANIAITDNSPDCEVNYYGPIPSKVTTPKHFGYPHCHTGAVGGPAATPYTRAPGVGDPIPDPNTNANQAKMQCSATTGKSPAYFAAVQAAGPHEAPLGMRFVNWKSKSNFPKAYQNVALVATHGSWNRDPSSSGAIGARVFALTLGAKDQSVKWEPFLSGGLPGDKGDPNGPNPKPPSNAPWVGRPVDLEQLPDGSFLVSDDFGGRVFRIAYCAGQAYGNGANLGVGRCGGFPRQGVEGSDNGNTMKLPSKPADVKPCRVRTSEDDSTPPVAYAHCQTLDMTGRGVWATIAWTFKAVPGDSSKVRLSSAVVLDDFAGVVGSGWVGHGLPDAGNRFFAMSGGTVVISKQASFSAASISDVLMGAPGTECHSTSCFVATKDGTFYDKANTLKAHMAGGALVQRAEFLVDKTTLKSWGSKALVMLAVGDTDANTGTMSQHWIVPTFKIPYSDADLDPSIPSDARVANPRVLAAPSDGTPVAPYPAAAVGCAVDGVTYGHCADLTIGSLTVTHYYTIAGGVVSAAIRANPGAGAWVGWNYNSDAPGAMVSANANAIFILGGPGAPLTIARRLTSYSPADWPDSTIFSNAVAKMLQGGDLLLTFGFNFPAGQPSIMLNHGTGSWNPASATARNPATGLSQHAVTPPKLCLRASGEIAPLNACNSCD